MKKILLLTLCLATTVLPQTQKASKTKKIISYIKKHINNIADQVSETTLKTITTLSFTTALLSGLAISEERINEVKNTEKALTLLAKDIHNIFGDSSNIDYEEKISTYFAPKKTICILATISTVYFGSSWIKKIYKQSQKTPNKAKKITEQ